MVSTSLSDFKSVIHKDWKKIAVAVLIIGVTSSAFAQAAGSTWGGSALCLVARNTKTTIGVAAVIGILIGGIMALFKKGDVLVDTVITIVIVCGIAALAGAIISAMGYTDVCGL